jgi:hypothetical protein
MSPVKVIGAAFLALDLGLRAGGFHLDVPSYHGEPQPANPFNVVATATAQAVLPIRGSYLSRIPI